MKTTVLVGGGARGFRDVAGDTAQAKRTDGRTSTRLTVVGIGEPNSKLSWEKAAASCGADALQSHELARYAAPSKSSSSSASDVCGDLVGPWQGIASALATCASAARSPQCAMRPHHEQPATNIADQTIPKQAIAAMAGCFSPRITSAA